MNEWVGGGITAVAMAIAGLIGWVVILTRNSKAVEAIQATVDEAKKNIGVRLDSHSADLKRISADFISRREFDEKLESNMNSINGNYTNIREQLAMHGRWLEFAIFNKKPEQPGI